MPGGRSYPAPMHALLATILSLVPQQPIDLTADRTRIVEVDREEGQYLGHVSTILLADGKTILAAYPKGHGKGAIVMQRSEDGGKTWSGRLPVPASFADSQEVPTLFRVVDQGGKERIVLWSGLHPAKLAHSEDDGRTWSDLAPAGDWGGIVVMGDLVATTTKGRYLAFFHDDGRFLQKGGKAAGTFTLLQTESTDGGLSWSAPRAIWSGSDVHLCEPGCVRSPDGKEIALVLRENRRKQESRVMFSRDEGATWSDPSPAHPALTGDRHTLRYAKDGRLVAVYRDMRLGDSNDWKGDFVAWVGTYDDIRKGTGGQYRVRLLDNQDSWDCGYPGLEVLPDGTFVATTYGHWEKGAQPWIRSVRFTLAELDVRSSPATEPTKSKGSEPNAKPTLEDDLETLIRYAPVAKAPTDQRITDAEKRLFAAMQRIARKESPVRTSLARLFEERRTSLVPTEKSPIRSRDPLARVLVKFDDERTHTTPTEHVVAHPASATFPGAVPADAMRTHFGATLSIATPGRRSIGVYAAPGEALRVAIGDGKAVPPKGLRLRIGAHSDDIARRPSWPRMPRISRTFALDRGELTVANAYGGLVYLECDEGLSGSIDLQITGCVESPLFELGVTNATVWREHLRQRPAPWAELVTDKIALTVPSERIRSLDDPTELLQFWNAIADAAADLAARPRERKRAERYVADVEISAGYMHAGYPIMTHLDAAKDMVDLQRMKRGPWGLFHELGHNHQSKDWTFAGTGEVTVNLFSLYLCDTLCGIAWNEAWGGNLARAEQKLALALADGRKPWAPGKGGELDLSLRLLMYSQLQRAFGWELFVHAFAEYRDAKENERPKTEDEKRDQWLVRASRSIDRDLGPFFEAWGLPVSAAAREQVAALPDWMPDNWPAPTAK